MDKEHGRVELRNIWVSDEPKVYNYADFPHSRQFFLVEREVDRHQKGEWKHTVEFAYGVTSLDKKQAGAQRLLELNRGHWEIENRVHYARDVTYDEDRCRIRTGNGPRTMAGLRNLSMGIARLMGFRYIPDAIRHFLFCRSRKETMALWGIW
ncbi:MAG: ISAs1 family transposase [bacterium]|nr:ISAs1 family transposase [bacterium]